MRKLLVTLIALGFSGVAMAGMGTSGAPHNFYDGQCGITGDWANSTASNCSETWNVTDEICAVCHTPHSKDDLLFVEGQLWNHDLTAETFVLYPDSFGTVDGNIAQPDGSSKLCLGCHDGVTALDAFGTHAPTAGATIDNATFGYRADVNLSNDLAYSHPVSVEYDPAKDTDLHALASAFGTGGNVADVLENDGTVNRVQCASCHDPHGDRAGNKYLTRIDNTGSAMCLACHDK